MATPERAVFRIPCPPTLSGAVLRREIVRFLTLYGGQLSHQGNSLLLSVQVTGWTEARRHALPELARRL